MGALHSAATTLPIRVSVRPNVLSKCMRVLYVHFEHQYYKYLSNTTPHI